MRMNKLIVGLLVLGLAVAMLGVAGLAKKGQDPSATVDENVSWTIQGFVELTIDESAFDFGTIAAGVDSVTAENANTLHVYSNTDWTLSYLISGNGSDHLAIALSADSGTGNADIVVDYTLNNLRSMDPGSYTAVVTYTVTAK